MFKRTAILLMLLALSGLLKLHAQCCSMGSPAGASTYVGVLAKNHLRLITFYRNNYLDTYYKGESRSNTTNFMKRSYFNYTGVTLSYGITKRLTAEAEIGYFINKTRIYELPLSTFKQRGYGLSNGYITAKYGALIKPIQKIELTVGAGFKFPFTREPLYVDRVLLPIDLQPSTQAYGALGLLIFSKDFPKLGMRLLSLNRFEYNLAGKTDYQYGSSLSNSVFLSKKIIRNLFGIFMIRNEYKMPDLNAGKQEINTGSDVTFLSAQLSYSLFSKWHIAGLFDYPLYKNYVGTQLSPKYSFAFSLTRDLDLNKKSK